MFKLKILYYYLLTLYGRRFGSRAALLAFQDRKIKKHLSWVRKHSRFYREWTGGIIDKKIMMDRFTDLNTVGIDRDEAFRVAFQAEESRDFSPTLNGVTIGLSSGTSGNRGLFLVSDQERARHAGTMLAKILPRSIFSSYRVAFFMRANSNLYTASQGSRIQFEFYDLLKNVDEHLDRLRVQRPDLLFAPPSMLIRLAQAQSQGAISLNPERIFSIAETLDPLDQKKIESAFGQKVYQIYQCTEGFLGATCAEGVLHLNEDCVRIEPEWLDDSKTKFMPIITDFTRTSQPIIRYRLNDILTVRKTPCPCGSAMMALECIEGRADDVLVFLSAVGEKVTVFPDFIRRAVLSSSDRIEEYQVRQSIDGELEIHLQAPADSLAMIHNQIQCEVESFASLVSARVPLIRFHEGIPALEGKKLRRVMRV
jgi:putative adenylate-forming enzyme